MKSPDSEKERDMRRENPSPGQADRGTVSTVDARQLLGSSGVLRIVLDGEIYTLRLTKNQRLILTK